jgi:hypothetical protein
MERNPSLSGRPGYTRRKLVIQWRLVMTERLCNLFIAGAAMAGAIPAGRAEIAATIQYDFVQQPTGLSSDFASRDGVSLKFLVIKAIDGFQIDGALWAASGRQASDTTLIMMVHGSGGSYQRAPESALGWRLASIGYAALAISTRQHDDGINTDNFFDVCRDIDAAVSDRAAAGLQTVGPPGTQPGQCPGAVLRSHSLGPGYQRRGLARSVWQPAVEITRDSRAG